VVQDKKPTEDTGDLAPNATVIHENFTQAPADDEVKASFIVIAGGEIGMEIEVHGHGQVFGRSPLAHAVFPSPSVSRQHLRIDRVEEAGRAGFKLTDLGSSNGTLVNGTRVKEALLCNGDKVAMGEVVFKFVLEDAIEHAFHRQVHQLIHYDQLTGLLTMDSFRMRLDEHMRATSGDVRFVLAMTDLDGLKKVNDTHGHLAGRMVVREMGVMMRQTLRPEDIAGLYGGDEAVVLYPRATLDAAAAVAENLRATIEARVFEQDGNRFQVTISQGLAEWPRHGRTVQQIIAAADRALYAAKAAGRNRVMRAE
jgi:diguanylate cyclase (GGDEF)-like protein